MAVRRHMNRGWIGLPEFSRILYETTYFYPGESYPEWLERIVLPYSNDKEHAERMMAYIHNYWFHPSTPISSGRGLPIACYVSHIPDDRNGIFDGYYEGMWLGAEGGGRGVHWSDVRGAGAPVGHTEKEITEYYTLRREGKTEEAKSRFVTSSGLIPFLGISDRATYGISQANVRRSSETAYVHISHPDILDFLDIRLETGDRNRRTPNLHHAVIVTDAFMDAVQNLQPWNLVCPHSGEIVDTVDAFKLWMDILEIRKTEAGEPNILFIDNVNRQIPEEYRANNMKVSCSNICTEIMLYTDPDNTAVCCLGSLNLEQWDEYKDQINQVVADCTDYLDNVLQSFIDKTEGRKGFEKARRSTMNERSIGLGVMGFHSYLQKKSIPFESPMAVGVNQRIFKAIRKASDKHQAELPPEVSCPLSVKAGTKRRNTHTLAVAPTMSISTLSNLTSSGIEPWMANQFVKKVPQGSYTIRNKYLEQLIKQESLKRDSPHIWETQQWQDIGKHHGSVQHLEWMDDYTKDVFKTAYEVDQRQLVKLAGDRTPHIDQGQSVNLFLPAKVSYEELYAIHMMAYDAGVKSLYYLRSTSAEMADATTKERHEIIIEDDACVACT